MSLVTVPQPDIQALRDLFPAYRLLNKEMTQKKCRIHSLLKKYLYGFPQEEIFTKKGRAMIRRISAERTLKFQLNLLLDRFERDEADAKALEREILVAAAPFMKETEVLTGMKGVSVFIAAAIVTDIIDVSRFRNPRRSHRICGLRRRWPIRTLRWASGG